MSIFKRAHYQMIAEELSRYREFAQDSYEVKGVIQEPASMFQEDNPNFKRERFLKACGMGEE